MFHATTVLAVRHRDQTVMASDGQVTFGETVVKQTARKIRKLYNDRVLAGFAGSAADSFALFSRFEAALPADVRITAVQPRREADGSFAISVAVQARRVEGVDGFIEALEGQGTFKNVLPAEEQTDEDGLIDAVLDGTYLPEAPAAAAEPAPAPQAGPSPPRASARATSSHD